MQEVPKPPLSPIFRWAGSKRKHLHILQNFWNPHYKRYVEPFVGSAALFFHLQPNRALLGDINRDLIEAYELIKQRPDEIFHAVTAIPRGEQQYYRERSKNPNTLTRFQRVVRFVYLNRNCFNGLYRTNIKGEFNVPYAHTRAGIIPRIEDFRRASLLLCSTTLKCTDFGAILSSVRKDDFVFLDPPYAVESRRVFCEYDSRVFTSKDLTRLASHLDRINKRGGKFVLTYADCKEAKTIFHKWNRRRIRVRRNIAGFAEARRFAYEVLVTNIENRS